MLRSSICESLAPSVHAAILKIIFLFFRNFLSWSHVKEILINLLPDYMENQWHGVLLVAEHEFEIRSNEIKMADAI